MQPCSLLRYIAPNAVTVASRVGLTASTTLSSKLKNVENNSCHNKTSKEHESESESVHLYPFSSNNITTSNNINGSGNNTINPTQNA